jgi:hypothetical protein
VQPSKKHRKRSLAESAVKFNARRKFLVILSRLLFVKASCRLGEKGKVEKLLRDTLEPPRCPFSSPPGHQKYIEAPSPAIQGRARVCACARVRGCAGARASGGSRFACEADVPSFRIHELSVALLDVEEKHGAESSLVFYFAGRHGVYLLFD